MWEAFGRCITAVNEARAEYRAKLTSLELAQDDLHEARQYKIVAVIFAVLGLISLVWTAGNSESLIPAVSFLGLALGFFLTGTYKRRKAKKALKKAQADETANAVEGEEC